MTPSRRYQSPDVAGGPAVEPTRIEARQGAAARVIDGGAGAFEHAAGRIVSNFLVSAKVERRPGLYGLGTERDPM